jgi:hypothetical protein
VKRTPKAAARAVLTNWQGSPCPRCAGPLRYDSDLPAASPGTALVLLTCEAGHLWQERMSLESLHSGVFVERREDLEQRRAGRERPAATPAVAVGPADDDGGQQA